MACLVLITFYFICIHKYFPHKTFLVDILETVIGVEKSTTSVFFNKDVLECLLCIFYCVRMEILPIRNSLTCIMAAFVQPCCHGSSMHIRLHLPNNSPSGPFDRESALEI